MKDSGTPKIILNEGYIDLRNCTEGAQAQNSTTWSRNSSTNFNSANDQSTNCRFPSKDRQLVNTGLKKLVSSYNTHNSSNVSKLVSSKKGRSKEKTSLFVTRSKRPQSQRDVLKSRSEVSVSTPGKKPSEQISENRCSSPLIISKIEEVPEKVEKPVSRFTMTTLPNTEKKSKTEKSIEELLHMVGCDSVSKTRLHEYDQPQWKDTRLAEKYSVLKVPWRRTYTLPVFSKASIICNGMSKPNDFADRKTYLYDDGTEIDSVYDDQKKKNYMFQNHFMIMLFVCGTICGILLVSLLIWFLFGSEVIKAAVIKPKIKKQEQFTIKRYAKLLGGSVVHFISSVVKSIGRAFSIPTQHVFRSPPECQPWPTLQHQD